MLQALDAGDEFRSAQQLHEQLRVTGTPVGLATVYRTLQALADAGDVDTVRTDDGETRFRRCAASGHHHHLVCTACGRTIEVSASDVEAWTRRMATQHGFTDVRHHIELFGTCADCAGVSEPGRTPDR